MIDQRIIVCAVIAVAGHVVLGESLSSLPPRDPPPRDHKIEIRVFSPPPAEPPPEPPKPEPETKPEPKLVDKPAAKPTGARIHDTAPKDAPVAEHAVVAPESAEPQVFGSTLESTSQGGKTETKVGNTTQPTAGSAAAPVKPAGAAVAAYEVTKMPLPQGRCSGKYTDDAKAAGVEGTVVLDLIVDEQGQARDISVVSGLEHGLTAAAIAALKGCHFTPGEKDGHTVAVRVRGFKIRFVLQDAQ